MWGLIIFLLQYLFKGKPKTREIFLSFPSASSSLFNEQMGKIIEDPKWTIVNVQMLSIPDSISAIIYCKEKYHGQ